MPLPHSCFFKNQSPRLPASKLACRQAGAIVSSGNDRRSACSFGSCHRSFSVRHSTRNALYQSFAKAFCAACSSRIFPSGASLPDRLQRTFSVRHFAPNPCTGDFASDALRRIHCTGCLTFLPVSGTRNALIAPEPGARPTYFPGRFRSRRRDC